MHDALTPNGWKISILLEELGLPSCRVRGDASDGLARKSLPHPCSRSLAWRSRSEAAHPRLDRHTTSVTAVVMVVMMVMMVVVTMPPNDDHGPTAPMAVMVVMVVMMELRQLYVAVRGSGGTLVQDL